MRDYRPAGSRAVQPVSPANLPPEVAEFAAHIPAAQIPYTVAVLLVRFWTERTTSGGGRDNAPNLDSDKLLTAGELANRLGVRESWVRTEERAGRIPSVRLGRYVRFKWPEVDRALATVRGQED